MLQKFLLTLQPWQKYLIKAVTFVAVCIATLGFMLCIAAFMIIRIDTPDYVLIPLTTILLTLSSFIDSFMLAKVMRENGIVIGVSVGAVFTVLVILLAVYHGTLALTGLFFSKITAVFFAGALGGILGVNS